MEHPNPEADLTAAATPDTGTGEAPPAEAQPAGAPEETTPSPADESGEAHAPAESETAQASAEPSGEDADPEDDAAEETPEDGAPEADEEPAGAAEGEEPDELATLAAQSIQKRLPPPAEERLTALLKENLLAGRTGVARIVKELPLLPWMVAVNGVTATWPEMKPASRTQLLSGLAKVESDANRRVRLSLARGLFKQDVPLAMKLAVAVAKEMRDKATGAIDNRNAQAFSGVMIGRAKPWIAQLPLADLKPADADALVHCALVSVFALPHAPMTQLGILKWAGPAGRLAKLHPVATEAITKGLARWSAKWQNAARNEVPELPEAIRETLKAAPPPAPAPEQKRKGGEETRPEGEATPAAEAPAEEANEGAAAAAATPPREERPARPPQPQPPQQQKPRPVYESKTVPPKRQDQRSGFNLHETLRQIEKEFSHLRSELQSTENKLRQREDELRKGGRRPQQGTPIIKGEPTLEELARLNLQLEARNQELLDRISELTTDAETRAAAMAAASEAGATGEAGPELQLRKLLELKLQEDFDDFIALEKESPDLVIQQHYRTLLRHVLEVLLQEGVTFQGGPLPIIVPQPPPPLPKRQKRAPIDEDEDEDDNLDHLDQLDPQENDDEEEDDEENEEDENHEHDDEEVEDETDAGNEDNDLSEDEVQDVDEGDEVGTRSENISEEAEASDTDEQASRGNDVADEDGSSDDANTEENSNEDAPSEAPENHREEPRRD